MINRRSAYWWVVLFLFLSGSWDSVNAQIYDFQTRFGASFSKEIFSDLDLSLDVGQRFYDNSLRYDRTLLTAGGDYNLGRGFNISAGIRWIFLQDLRMEFQNRFRLNVDASYRYNIGSISIRYRTRFQYGFDDQIAVENFSGANFVNRNRLGLSYHIFGTKISLFASGEVYLHLNEPGGMFFYRAKYTGGMEYDLNMLNSLEFYYSFDQEFNLANPYIASIVGIGYSHKF